MSYEILVFEPETVTDADFPQWWKQVSQWEEPHDYDTTERSTRPIKSFYRALIRTFPPLNGPYALMDEELDAREAEGLPVGDYVIGADFIYIGVGWSHADALVRTVGELARMHRLAIAYVSGDSSIIRP